MTIPQRGKRSAVAAIMDIEKGIGGVPGKQCSHEGCNVIIESTWIEKIGQSEDGTKQWVYWIDQHDKFIHRHNVAWSASREGSNGTSKVATTQLSRAVLGELEAANASEASIEIAKGMIALASGSNAAQALKALNALSIRIGEEWEARKPSSTQVCPLCNRRPSGDVHITLSPGTMKDLRRFKDLPLDDGE